MTESATSFDTGSKLRVVRASAGTGKTYALTTRYLAVLRSGADPSTVLATTFTRKAAGEVFNRVLTRLADATLDADARDRLNTDLRAEGSLPRALPPLSVSDVREMLQRLTRSMDHVAVSTIDSFFSRVAGAFAVELGLPIDPTLTDDGSALAADLRQDAIDALLGEAAENDFASLLALLRQLHQDSNRRSVTKTLDDLFTGESGGMFGVYRQAPEPAKWPALALPDRLDDPVLNACIAELADCESLLPKTKTGKPNQRWAKAFAGDIAKAHRRDWEGLLKSGLAKAAQSAGVYFSEPIPEPMRALLDSLAGHAAAVLLEQHNRQSASTHALLAKFAEHFARRCRAERVLMFADVSDALARRLGGLGNESSGWADDLAYRLDGRVEHLLIDEFQDTSVDQFAVLWPLIDEASSDATSGKSVFCVGDAKQSIYGWRGGRPELLDALSNRLEPRGLSRQSLHKSYRSSPAVLAAVNAVFGQLDRAGSWSGDALALRRFTEAFEDHEAADETMPGEVRFLTTARGRGEETGNTGNAELEGAHEHAVAKHVRELLGRHPGATLGVLTRTNAQANAVLHALRSAGVEASGETGTAVTDHPAVGVILSALTLADHPGDTVAAFHPARSPLGEVLRFAGEAAWRSKEKRLDVSLRIRGALSDEGYAAVVAGWVAALRPVCDAAAWRRLVQLVSLAERYRPTSASRPSAFVRFVKTASVESDAPARVRVMTIHRAKGLEFDVVVLPTLHSPMRFTTTVLTHRASEAGPIDAVYRAGNADVRALSDTLSALYDAERQRWVYEQLCLLYVATTRAKYGLHALVPPTTKGGQTFASLLRETLAPDRDASEPGTELFAVAHRGGLPAVQTNRNEAEDPTKTTVAEPGEVQPNATVRGTWPLTRSRGVGRVTRPSGAATDPVEVKSLFSPTSPGVLFGRRLHTAWEQLAFLDDDKELAKLTEKLDALRADDPAAAEHLERALRQPAVRDVFRRRGAAGVWRERAFSLAEGEPGPDGLPRVVNGVIDRVVWWEGHAGKPTRAEVVDFKTDAFDPVVDITLQVAEAVERHRDQLRWYRRAAAALLGLGVGAVLARLAFTSIGEVVELDAD